MATKLEKIIKHFVRMAAVQGGKNGNKARQNNKAFCTNTNSCSTRRKKWQQSSKK